jgi:hypothetical protein
MASKTKSRGSHSDLTGIEEDEIPGDEQGRCQSSPEASLFDEEKEAHGVHCWRLML